MNDRQKVVIVSVALALFIGAVVWLLGGVVPALRTETALAVGLPIIIGIAILLPALKSRIK